MGTFSTTVMAASHRIMELAVRPRLRAPVAPLIDIATADRSFVLDEKQLVGVKITSAHPLVLEDDENGIFFIDPLTTVIALIGNVIGVDVMWVVVV